MHYVYISIGSNMGHRLRNCCDGIHALCADGRVRLLAKSRFYETEPVDYLDQAWFLNAALKASTELTPVELLAHMQEIQTTFGRKKDGPRFGPRMLDLDIIFYDNLILDTPYLTIPHPRMHKRRFVLQPICDIDPKIVHPSLNRDVKKLLDQLKEEGQQLRPCSYDC